MKRQHLAALIVVFVLLFVFVPLVAAAPRLQDPAPADDLVPFDLSGLVIGSVSLSPIIFLLVELGKRSGLLKSSQAKLYAVLALAVVGYALMLLSQANTALAPVMASILQFGQALLAILLPSVGAVAAHRTKQWTRNSNPQ